MKPGASFNRASPANRAHVNSPKTTEQRIHVHIMVQMSDNFEKIEFTKHYPLHLEK